MGGYYGLQAAGMDAGMAGNWVQLTVFCFLCFGWVGSYVWRVANKEMSYVKQLEAYEDAVMAKRLEEMPEAERARPRRTFSRKSASPPLAQKSAPPRTAWGRAAGGGVGMAAVAAAARRAEGGTADDTLHPLSFSLSINPPAPPAPAAPAAAPCPERAAWRQNRP